jgi:hypothetical protein
VGQASAHLTSRGGTWRGRIRRPAKGERERARIWAPRPSGPAEGTAAHAAAQSAKRQACPAFRALSAERQANATQPHTAETAANAAAQSAKRQAGPAFRALSAECQANAPQSHTKDTAAHAAASSAKRQAGPSYRAGARASMEMAAVGLDI